MRRLARTAALAAMAGCLVPAASPAASGDDVRIRTADQGRALAQGAIAVRVRASEMSRVELRASAPGVRRLTGRERIRFDTAGSRNASLLLTAAGRTALEAASSRCEPLSVRVGATIDSAGRGKRRHEAAKRPLAADQGRCERPSPGPGGEDPALPAPGPGTPAPGPGGPASPPGNKPTKLRAGAGVADITPPVGTPMFAYTARSRTMDTDPLTDPQKALQVISHADDDFYAKSFEPSVGIHTRVRASAIVLERDGEKFALVQADLGGVPHALVQSVLEQIESTGIEPENLLLSATHTHSSTGPIWPADSGGYNLLGGDFFDPRVFGLTADGIAEAIVKADSRLEPARAGVGTTELRNASNNRAFEPFLRNPEAEGLDEQAAREASLNRELTVVRFDGTDGAPIALWSNFAVHQTSFGASNLLLSGDNAATTERIVEREVARDAGLPAPAPGAPGESDGPVLAWTTGAQGDVSPDGGPANPDGEPLEWARGAAAGANMAGRKIAGGILEAWRDAGGALSGDLEIGARRTFVSLDGKQADGEPVGPITVLGSGGIAPDAHESGYPEELPEPPIYCAPFDGFAGPGQGMKFPAVAGTGLVPLTSPISLMRIGDLGIASFPFEITTTMGRRITGAVESESGGELDSAVVAGLTNGYQSYTATPEEYDGCQYEGSFTLFGRRQGPLLRDTATELVPALVDGAPMPEGDSEPPPLADGLDPLPTATPTPDAGNVVAEPEPTVRRDGRASFTWKGGDPGTVDAPRGETLVRLERLVGGEWRVVGTEEGPEDTTAFDQSADTWTETWQFSECDPLGTYRFRATGRSMASPGTEPEPYEAVSREFELLPTPPLEIIGAPTVSGTTARVRARYPDPGETLLAVARRVRHGSATIRLAGGREVVATPDDQGLAFEAKVPAGSEIQDVAVSDGCGNSTP
jgi:neutral ceramidase